MCSETIVTVSSLSPIARGDTDLLSPVSQALPSDPKPLGLRVTCLECLLACLFADKQSHHPLASEQPGKSVSYLILSIFTWPKPIADKTPIKTWAWEIRPQSREPGLFSWSKICVFFFPLLFFFFWQKRKRSKFKNNVQSTFDSCRICTGFSRFQQIIHHLFER